MNRTAIFQFSTIAAAALLTACSGGSGNSGSSNGLSAASQEPINITAENKDQVISSSQQAMTYADTGTSFAESFGGSGTASDKLSPLATDGCDSGSYTESGNSASFNDCTFTMDGVTLRVDGSLTITDTSATFDNLTYETISNTGGSTSSSVLVFDGSINYQETGSTEEFSYDNYIISVEGDVDTQEESFSYEVLYALNGSYTWTETATGEEESYDLTFSFDFQSDDLDPEAAGEIVVGSIDLETNPDIFTADADSYPSEGKLMVNGAGGSMISAEFGVCPTGEASVSINGGAAACEIFVY